MNKKTQQFINIVLGPLVIPMLRLYTRVTHQERSRVVLLNEMNEVLLVQGVIGSKWSLPGGGIERDETPIEAAIREVHEETGIRLTDDMVRGIAVIPAGEVAKVNYTAHLFVAHVSKQSLPANQHNTTEIISLVWAPLSVLPKHVSSLTRVALDQLSKQ